MALNFIAQLPIVSETDLIYGNKCPICGENYATNIPSSDIVTENAIRLPCGHEFGHGCLSTWLSPEEGKNTCPLCRRELFPAAAPDLAEASVPSHDITWNMNWDAMASDLDTELSASGIVHRSPPFRDWLLYTQLRGLGASLPPWRPSGTNPGPRLDSGQEEALFGELRRRGAFRLLPVPVGPLVSDREVWMFLRGQGYSYDPNYAARAHECAWSRI